MKLVDNEKEIKRKKQQEMLDKKYAARMKTRDKLEQKLGSLLNWKPLPGREAVKQEKGFCECGHRINVKYFVTDGSRTVSIGSECIEHFLGLDRAILAEKEIRGFKKLQTIRKEGKPFEYKAYKDGESYQIGKAAYHFKPDSYIPTVVRWK